MGEAGAVRLRLIQPVLCKIFKQKSRKKKTRRNENYMFSRSPPPVSPPSAYPQPMKPNPPSAYPQPMNPNPPAAQSNFQPMNPNPLAVQSNFQPMNPNPPFADSQPMAMSEQEMTDVLTQMLNTQHHLIMVQEQKVLQWQMRIMRAQIEQIIMNNLRRLNDPDNQG